ncbi:MAG: response regulator [Spirochaetes bacterium]|nr:MAG: response regulator [Spirochaetota bacterium]
MKIKYKLIIIFVFIIVASTVPFGLFILSQAENESLDTLSQQGKYYSWILSRSASNTLLLNGGDIEASRVDIQDTLSMLENLREYGLVYADAILISKREEFHGLVLASYSTTVLAGKEVAPGRLDNTEIDRLKKLPVPNETTLPGVEGTCYEYASLETGTRTPSLCIGRLIFSRSIALKPVYRIRAIVLLSLVVIIAFAGALALLFGYLITKPIQDLTSGVQRFEKGDLDYRVKVTAHDEVGSLAMTFNNLAEGLKQQIARLEVMNRELRRVNELKDEFLANISHEIRTPLYGITGIAESLLEGSAGELNPEARHNLSLVTASGRRLSDLVNDILDFSQLRHQDIILSMEPVNIHSICQLVISVLEPLRRKKEIAFHNTIPPDIARVYGDRNRLQQVLVNLVGNAIKFTERGDITISASESPERPGMTIITVRDTGIGISRERLAGIFEYFEQADGSDTRAFGGMGLGLSITKRLVELHGGAIWAESEPGKGSAFHFTLKRSFEKIAHEPPETGRAALPEPPSLSVHGEIINPTVSEKASRSGRKILVVDDEPVIIQVLVNFLTLEGYQVVTATSGPQALALLEEGLSPDLILLDVMLPFVSGYDVCKRIRQKYPPHELPVLMLTAKSKAEDMVTGIEAGANDYLTKPVNRSELLARVRSLITIKSSMKEHQRLSMLQREMRLAQEIQSTLLPEKAPYMKGLETSVLYRPMHEVGGDFYDFNVLGPSEMGVLIADVTGHGIPAAFVSAMLQATYSVYKEDVRDPSTLMKGMNTVMSAYTHGQFATTCYSLLDLANRRILHANAGHCPMIVMKRRERKVRYERQNERPLGVDVSSEYTTRSTEIDEGDRVILFTDCIPESRNASGEFFGYPNFFRLIEESAHMGCRDFSQRVLETVTAWKGGGAQTRLDDDFTLIVIDVVE